MNLLFEFGGEEGVGVSGVEVEGFADEGPAHGARGEGEACMAGREEFEEGEREEG